MRALLGRALMVCVAVWDLSHAATRAPDRVALEQVLERQEQAIGNMRALRTLVLELSMEEPEQIYDLTMRVLRPDRMRVDLRKLGVSVYSEGFGSHGPWQQHLLQWSPRPTSARGGEAISNGVEGSAWGRSLREMRGRGHSVTLLATTASQEIGVRVVFRNGTRRDYFIDPGNFRIVRSVQVYALHPDHEGGAQVPQPIESLYHDYRTVDGYVFPMRIENRDRSSGTIIQTVRVRRLRVNEKMHPHVFDGR